MRFLGDPTAAQAALLEDLAVHWVRTAEAERAGLARSLHNELGGLLTVMRLDLAHLRRTPGLPEAALELLSVLDARLKEGLAVERDLVEGLRPSLLDLLGLVPALERLCADTACRLSLPVSVLAQPVHLGEEAALTVYRLVQAALSNVAQHAQCRSVQVSLQPLGADRVQVRVTDDGVGFDPANIPPGRYGLLGARFRMQSVGGQLSVHSAPGAGTVLQAELPALHPASTTPVRS